MKVKAKLLSPLLIIAMVVSLMAGALMVAPQVVAGNGNPDGETTLDVSISAPEAVYECDTFVVNATVNNTGGATAENVVATLAVYGDASLVTGDSPDRDLGDIASGESEEAVWTLHCDGSGEVLFVVTAKGDNTPLSYDTATMDQDAMTKDFWVDLTQPTEATFSTCQDFLVNATIYNDTGYEVTVAPAGIVLTVDPAATASIVSGPLPAPTDTVYTIPDEGSLPLTWILHCDEVGYSTLKVVVAGALTITGESVGTGDGTTTVFYLDHIPVVPDSETIYLIGQVTTFTYTIDYPTGTITFTPAPEVDIPIVADYSVGGTSDGDSTWILQQTPAALEATITPADSTTFSACDDFTVNVTVTNTGDAAATNVSGTVEITGNVDIEGTHTFDLGTIPGGESRDATWAAHCDDVGDVIIEVTELSMAIAGEIVGIGDASETVFTLDFSPVVADSETIYVDGTPQVKDTDYTIDYGTGTITFITVPGDGAIISADYRALTVAIEGESVGTGDASETVFTLANTPVVADTETVYLDGVATTAYTIDYATGTITFTTAPGDGVVITADYHAGTVAALPSVTVHQVPLSVVIDYYPCSANVCDDFTIEAVVNNSSQTDVTDVTATIHIEGPATLTLDDSATKTLGPIPAGESQDVGWTVHCDGYGPVIITVSTTGTYLVDDTPVEFTVTSDPVTVTQRGAVLGVVITDPSPVYICEDFWVYAYIYNSGSVNATAVTATIDISVVITGESVGTGDGETTVFTLDNTPVVPDSETIYLDGVATTAYTIDDATGEITFDTAPATGVVITADYRFVPATGEGASLLPGESATKTVGTISYGLYGIASWELHCDGPEKVMFEVTVDGMEEDGVIPIPDDDLYPDTITVQQGPPPPELIVIIESPIYDEWYEVYTYIATGEEFMVTAKLYNPSDTPLIDVTATISFPGFWDGLPGIPPPLSVADATIEFDEIPGAGYVFATWTVQADWAGIGGWMPISGVDIQVDAVGSDPNRPDADPITDNDSVGIYVYPAAHLVVDITAPTDGSTYTVCDEFDVTATVTNVGWADAWDVSLTLSVYPEGSVVLMEGGYTQDVGCLAGHGQEGSSELVTWKVHCKQSCSTTITVTAQGLDESGYYLEWYEWEGEWYYEPIPTPGAPIHAEFIENDSITVKQYDGANLAVDISYPEEIVDGQDYAVTAVISNTGDKAATGVAATLTIAGHASLLTGEYLTQTIGTIAAGSSATVEWVLHADDEGGVNLAVSATGTGINTASDSGAVQQAAAPAAPLAPAGYGGLIGGIIGGFALLGIIIFVGLFLRRSRA